LGGASERAFRLDEMVPLRGGGRDRTQRAALPGIPLSVNLFGPAFGDDPYVRAAASPVRHVRPGLPPFLILSAENDLPTLPEMAVEFHAALLRAGCSSQLFRVAERNHNSILFRAICLDDPVGRALVEFIAGQVAPGPGR